MSEVQPEQLDAALALYERNEERKMSQIVRRHLLANPGLKEALLADVTGRMREIFEEPDDVDDEERRLWGLGYME